MHCSLLSDLLGERRGEQLYVKSAEVKVGPVKDFVETLLEVTPSFWKSPIHNNTYRNECDTAYNTVENCTIRYEYVYGNKFDICT